MEPNDQKHVLLTDTTLRDGNHAVAHQLSLDNIAGYCRLAEKAAVPIVEIGHGNGLGASSLQVGLASNSDLAMLQTARSNLMTTKLGIHVIPGFATIDRDLKPALDCGVDVVRVAAHCTEADITERHIGFCREQGKNVFGVLMMSHMATPVQLCEEAKKMEAYGAEAIIIMDSAGAYLPEDVRERIIKMKDNLGIPVGFHAHNNLGLAIANTLTAIAAGASLADGSVRGFGAGAGNAQLEVLVAVLQKLGINSSVGLFPILDAADYAETHFIRVLPVIQSLSVVSGLAGVFSGFSKPVVRCAEEQGVDARDIFFELGRRKAVAGQEDLILEVALSLKKQKG